MQNNSSALSLLFRRCAAFLYDCLLLIALYFVITASAIWFNDGQAIQHWLFKLFLLAVSFLFFDWFWRHGGQTLGMRAWRIRVEATDSENVSFKHSAKRFLTGMLLLGITYVFMFFNPHKQALHDQLSNTKIIRYNN